MSSETILLFAGQGSRTVFSDTSSKTLIQKIEQHRGASEVLKHCHEAFLQDISSFTNHEREILTEEDGKLLATPEDLIKPPASLAENPVIQACTLYLNQILEYVLYATSEDGERIIKSLSESAGFCSGILPSLVIAIDAATESPIFQTHAVGSFRIALWIAIRSAIFSKAMAGSAWRDLPWSLVVAGITREDLQAILIDSSSQFSHRVGISAILRDDMFSLSGNGADLGRLQTLLPTATTCRPAFIHTCYHGGGDMEKVIQDIIQDVERLQIPVPQWKSLRIPVRSTVDGRLLASEQPETDTLLPTVLRCMLVHPVDWQTTVWAMIESTSQRLDKEIDLQSRILAIGPNTSSLFTATKGATLHPRLRIEHIPSRKPLTTETWHNDDIAIVGMSVDIPGSDDLHDFWDMLQNSTNVATEIPRSRFNLFDYYDKDAAKQPKPRKMAAKHGNFLKNPFQFDNAFFSLSPREAKSMDPQQRLILQSALKALDNAGYAPNATSSFEPDKMGVFIGAATGDYVDNTRNDIDVYYSPGTLRAFLSGRISYAFGFKGPSVVIDTACSSSLVAIHQACIALQRGDAVSALAGGVNVISSPDMYLGLARAHFLSPTGQCKPFDAAADGYCRAESSAVFVLKRMKDAIAHGDRIHAVIRGTSVNQSGTSKSITHPDADTQALLMGGLLDRSGVPAQSISVVEAHGTGTQAGDFCEVSSLQAVLGQDSGREHPLYLSSIKGNMGHSEAASGSIGLAKLLLMMQKKQIPPQASFHHLNPRLASINDHNIVIPTRLMDWNTPKNNPRRALLNNFGAAGSNAALILEEYCDNSRAASMPKRSSHVLNISARTTEALEEIRSRYLELLHTNSKSDPLSIADLCYSANARRQQHSEFRLSVTGHTIEDLATKLKNASVHKQITKRSQSLTVFMFTGQANIYRGMGAELLSTAPAFYEAVQECNAVLQRDGFKEVTHFIANDGESEEGGDIVVSQCACFVVQYALAKLWQSWGIEPDLVIGHSMGEYAAFVMAGALRLSEALLLIARRAQLMVTKCALNKSGMVACKLPLKVARNEVAQVFGEPERLVIACDNSPEDCVVAGDIDDLTTFLGHCKATGIKAVKLQVPFGFHSPAMEPLMDPLRRLCSDAIMTEGNIPIISSHLGKIVQPELLTADYLANHTRHTVNFTDAIQDLASFAGGQKLRILEIGHTTGTATMAKSILKDSNATYSSSLRPTETPWNTICATLKGFFLDNAPVKWSEVYAGSAVKYLDSTPQYPLFPAEFVVPFRDSCLNQSNDQISEDVLPKLFFQLEKKSSNGTTSTSFEAKLSLMQSFIKAHIVGGTPLCPASIYTELALEAIDEQQPSLNGGTHVMRDINFESPLVCSDNQESNNSVSVIIDQKESTEKAPKFSFKAQSTDAAYCTGTASIEPVNDVQTLLRRKSAFVKKQIDSMLETEEMEGDSFSSRMIYDVVFPRVVSYSDPFLTLKRFQISPSGLEGYGTFQLPEIPPSTIFVCDPALVDTLLHTAGFVANNWINRDLACICVKVENITLLHDSIAASRDSSLSVYCSMVDCVDGFVIGDAYAMNGSGDIVAMAEGMHFKKTGLKAFQSYLARLSQSGNKQPATSGLNSTKSPVLSTEQQPATSGLNSAKSPILSTEHFRNNIQPRGQNPQVVDVLHREVRQLCGITSSVNPDAELSQLGIDSLMFIELTQALRRALPHLDSYNLDLSRCSTLREIEGVLLDMAGSSILSDTTASVESTFEAQEVSRNAATAFSPARPDPSNDSTFNMIKNLVQDICGCQVFDMDKDVTLESLGVDSLLSMELEQGLRQVAGISLEGDHGIISELTVGQLERLILGKLPQSQSSITPQSSPSPAPTDPATKLQNGQNSRNRLYLFHDGSGLSQQYAKIGKLGCDVYGVSSIDFAGIDSSVQTLEEFASRYISVLRLAGENSHGIMLGGWSFGGVLAFEIARQLHSLGTPPKGLILLDSPCPINHEPLPNAIIQKVVSTVFASHSGIQSCVEAQFKRNANLLKNYNPPIDQLTIPTIMLLSGQTCDAAMLCGLKYAWLDDVAFRKKMTQEWGRLVGGLFQTLKVDGNHFNMFEAKHLANLSKKLVAAYQAMV